MTASDRQGAQTGRPPDDVLVEAATALGWWGTLAGPLYSEGHLIVVAIRDRPSDDGNRLRGVLVPTESREGLREASLFAGHAERAVLVSENNTGLMQLRMAAAIMNIGVVVHGPSGTLLLDHSGPVVPALPSYERALDPWYQGFLASARSARQIRRCQRQAVSHTGGWKSAP